MSLSVVGASFAIVGKPNGNTHSSESLAYLLATTDPMGAFKNAGSYDRTVLATCKCTGPLNLTAVHCFLRPGLAYTHIDQHQRLTNAGKHKTEEVTATKSVTLTLEVGA